MSARRRDNGKWEVRWRQGGRRYSRTFDRKRDAQRFDVELRRRLQLGALGLFEQDVTLGEFVEEWWRTHVIPNLAVSTRVSYRHTWSKHVLPKLGGYRVGEVTPKVVARYRAELLSDGVGEPTVRRALAVLQSILTMAVTEELIASNPVAKVKKPVRVVARQVEPWPPATVEELRARLSVGHATLISVLAYAGLRPGEALALGWADVGERTLRVRRSTSRGSDAGPTGPAGPTGATGAPGPAGPAGADRELLVAAFAADRHREARGRRLRVRSVSSSIAHVTIELRRGRRIVTRVGGTAARGRNTIVVRTPRARGCYSLLLTAVAGTQRASDRAPLTVT